MLTNRQDKDRYATFLRAKKSQSALEYMMTYGWAILIIVIVAVILYSMGIFNPSSSLTTTITGFSGLGVTQAACINTVNNQILAIYVSNTVGYPVNVTDINVSGNNGVNTVQNVNSLLRAGQSGVFYVNGACNKSTSSYSGSVAIKYTEPSQILPGPYFSKGTVASVLSKSNPNLVGNFSNTSQIQTKGGYAAPSALTITMWIKLTHYDTVSAIAISAISSISESGNNGCCNWRLGPRTNGLFFDPGFWGDLTQGWTINYNQWYLLTMTLTNVTGHENLYAIYLNKTSYVSGSAISSALGIPPVEYIDIGSGQGSAPSLSGNIADMEIYGSALSVAQVSKLFDEGVGGAPISNAGLIGWWPLDGNPNDYSGNGNNGVATNVQWVSP